MPLYKYVLAERIDVLQNEMIRFSQPSALNDPWDMRPHIARLVNDDDMENILTNSAPQSDDQMIDYISELLQQIVKNNNLEDKTLDEIKQTVREADQEYPGELRALFDGAMSEAIEQMKQVMPGVVEHIPKAIDDSTGILSLTETPNHPLMWSHYAGNHSGLVIGFDETHQFFKSPRFGEPDDIGSVRRVKYSAERPRFDPLVDLSFMETMTDVDGIRWFEGMFFTKSLDWTYENEWRMLKALKQASKSFETPTGKVHLYSLPSECVSSIALGERMSVETRERIMQFLRNDSRYGHLRLFEARSSTETFMIELHELDFR